MYEREEVSSDMTWKEGRGLNGMVREGVSCHPEFYTGAVCPHQVLSLHHPNFIQQIEETVDLLASCQATTDSQSNSPTQGTHSILRNTKASQQASRSHREDSTRPSTGIGLFHCYQLSCFGG